MPTCCILFSFQRRQKREPIMLSLVSQYKVPINSTFIWTPDAQRNQWSSSWGMCETPEIVILLRLEDDSFGCWKHRVDGRKTMMMSNLTYWGRPTHVCISKLTSIGSGNDMLPGRCQAIFWTDATVLFIGPLGTYFSESYIECNIFSFKNMYWKCYLHNGSYFVSTSLS